MLDVPLVTGNGERTIVLVHGFTQRAGVWDAIANRLASRGWRVVAPDLPGHGPEARHDTASLGQAARLVTQAGGPALYVGYSLGARVVLRGLVDGLQEVERAVLVGARLGFPPGLAAERRQADEARAERIEARGTARFLDDWMALPFNDRVPPERQERELRLRNRAAGLAASLRHCGGGASPLLSDRQLRSIAVPVLTVTGEFDLPGVSGDARRLQESNDGIEWREISGAGHAVPFEIEPDRFAALIDNYARPSS